MDYATQVQMTVRSLKGPALSALVLMLWSRQWHDPVWSVKELKAGTGYTSGDVIADARDVLIGMGLCEAADRGRLGLRLIDRAVQQLGLFDALPPVGALVENGAAESEIDKIDLTPGSSSGSGRSEVTQRVIRATGDDAPVRSTKSISLPADIQPRLLPQDEVRSTKSISPAPAEHVPGLAVVTRDLVKLGCSQKLADACARAALAELPECFVRLDLFKWATYATSKSGRGIQNVGAFVARKLENCESPPDWFDYHDRDLAGTWDKELDRFEDEVERHLRHEDVEEDDEEDEAE